MKATLAHMRRWWADTLFKRLFLLMWVGLVASHLLAFVITTRVHMPPGAAPRGIERVPVLPSLPPMGTGAATPPRGPSGAGAPPGDGRLDRPPPPDDVPREPPPDLPGSPPPDHGSPADGGGLPASALWLDYGIRFIAIGLVAWFGARWLSEPMRRLAEASERLGQVLGHRSGRDGSGRSPPPHLDASRGTLEVRQTAQVFNAMAQRLHEQFDAQDLLMAAISHDLRTPLARLRVRLDAMAPPAQADRCIADVQEMDQLIGSVLEMVRGRQSGGERQRVDLGALAQSLVDDLAEQGHAASMAGAPESPALVVAQPQALRRVLGNLVGNALRHGGAARVAVAIDDDQVRLTIDDDGPGIAPDQLDAVFAPFHRAARRDAANDEATSDALDGARGAGTGLGLYIARDLAERNGGRLSLANRAEGGLRAELVLPRA